MSDSDGEYIHRMAHLFQNSNKGFSELKDLFNIFITATKSESWLRENLEKLTSVDINQPTEAFNIPAARELEKILLRDDDGSLEEIRILSVEESNPISAIMPGTGTGATVHGIVFLFDVKSDLDSVNVICNNPRLDFHSRYIKKLKRWVLKPVDGQLPDVKYILAEHVVVQQSSA